jgi:hypothetical protein
MFTVLKSFIDLQDNNHRYTTGDKFPREGYTPSAERIKELSTSKNRRGFALIKAEEAPTDKTEVEKPKPKKPAGRPRKK